MADKIRTQSEVVAMLRRVGFGPRPARVGAAIAMCEAPGPKQGGEPTADFALVGDLDLVDDTWGPSYGGFQIRSLKSQSGTGNYRDAEQLVRPKFNCEAARQVYLSQGWNAWATYSSGMYKAYLQDWFPPPAGVYVVMAGDTLGSIATKFKMTWQELARINNLHSPYTIYIGQQLRYVAE